VLLVGLTGGIGSGKSTVAELLAARGAHVVDADKVARDVVEPGTPALAKLVERFGAGVLDEDGRLDRAALAKLAFADERSHQDLEAITHPAINEEFLRRMMAAPPDAIVVCDVPLLAESKAAQARGYPIVIVVEAPRDLRLERLEQRGVPRADAEARMANQASDEERRKLATHVIDNSGDHAALERQVDALWPELELAAEAQQAREAEKAAERAREERHRGPVRSWCASLRARLRLRSRG
jgi:dephospho-CoA kinase